MVEPNFKFKEKVYITIGFYKGYYAIIDAFKETKEGIVYNVTAKLKEGTTIKLELIEAQMRPVKSFFGL